MTTTDQHEAARVAANAEVPIRLFVLKRLHRKIAAARAQRDSWRSRALYAERIIKDGVDLESKRLLDATIEEQLLVIRALKQEIANLQAHLDQLGKM